MTSCASDQQLLELLSEQLDPADEDWIVSHLDTCTRCQERLAELVPAVASRTARGLPPQGLRISFSRVFGVFHVNCRVIM